MLNRFTQFGLALALVSFAGIGAASAQDEDPCSEGDPCASDPCGDADPCADADPCGDADPCAGGDTGGDTGGDSAMDGGEAAAAHGMTNGKGKIAIMGSLGIGLSADFVGDPITISPDVSYGVTDKLDVGLYHTNYGLNGFWVDGVFGQGICATGDLCLDEVYNGPTGILAKFELASGKLSAAADGGLVLTNIAGDTMFMRLKVGADVNYMVNEKMVVMANPALFAGLNERDFNKESISIPVGLMYMVNEKIAAGVQSGIATTIEDAGDNLQIVLNLAGMMKIDDKLSVGGAFGFPNIAGNDGSSADFRSISVFGVYHL